MWFTRMLASSLMLAGTFCAGVSARTPAARGEKIAPKVFIVSMVGGIMNNTGDTVLMSI